MRGAGEGNVRGVAAVQVEWTRGAGGRWEMQEVPGTDTVYDAELVLLAMGFLGPEKYVANQLSEFYHPSDDHIWVRLPIKSF